jgi:hypothetical protein
VIAFDSVSGDMVQSDIPGNLFPVGIRGNYNNLIQDGIYEFPAPTAFVAGDEVYADEVTPGAMTVSTNDRFVGTFLTDSKLLVSMNSIGISSTVVPPGTPFPGGLINASPGQAVAWHAGASEFRAWEQSFSLAPQGILGNSNNIISNEQWVPGGSPFLNGVRYYAWYAGAPGGVLTPGDLTTTQNDFFVGRATTTDNLLVECINAPNWEDTRTLFAAEHDDAVGTHNEGSARGWVGLEANRNAASNSQPSSTGMIYYASDTGRVFYCSDGASNIWIEQTHFTGPVEIDNNALIEGQIRMPLKVLHDNVSDSMNPFAHNDRHLLGGADPLKGTVAQILNTGSLGPDAIAQTGAFPLPVTVIETLAFDFTGRTGNSTIQIYAPCYFNRAGDAVDISLAFFLDTVEITNPESIRAQHEIPTSGEATVTLVGFLTNVTAGAHTLEIRMGVEQNRPPNANDRMIMVTDLGLT